MKIGLKACSVFLSFYITFTGFSHFDKRIIASVVMKNKAIRKMNAVKISGGIFIVIVCV